MDDMQLRDRAVNRRSSGAAIPAKLEVADYETECHFKEERLLATAGRRITLQRMIGGRG
jgi:hypothetical protein